MKKNGGWLKRFWQEPVKNQLHMWMRLICANSSGEVESAVIFTNMECTALYLNPPAILNGVDTPQVTRCADLLDLELRIAEAKRMGLDTTSVEQKYNELIEEIRAKRHHSGNGR